MIFLPTNQPELVSDHGEVVARPLMVFQFSHAQQFNGRLPRLNLCAVAGTTTDEGVGQWL